MPVPLQNEPLPKNRLTLGFGGDMSYGGPNAARMILLPETLSSMRINQEEISNVIIFQT
jgi:hypothetical protein